MREINLSRKTMAFVLAGGRGSRLKELTDNRAKPAVFFGGKNRIIDFALSNALNSGIRRIGVATQYKAHSLIRHLHNGWSFFRAERNEGLDILPASQRAADGNWYLGTADAVTQNIDIIESYGVEYILILAGDHVYKQDYQVMIQQHVDTGADVTISCVEVPKEQAHELGIMGVDKDNRIIEFVEKPENPPTLPDDDNHSLASMGIYVFNTAYLIDLLHADANNPDSSHDFGKDIIPEIVNHGTAIAHRFSESCVGAGENNNHYWRDVGTIDAFWQANLDLTAFTPELDIYDREWPIWTHQEVTPPAKFVHDEDNRRGSAISSLISGGCIVSGARIYRSLLFSHVHCRSYSSLKNVVVLPQVTVGRRVKIKDAVIDKGVDIPEGTQIGYDVEDDAKRFTRTESGICLVTKKSLAALSDQ
jgi:glucose-1-phosphate adenylyltransferase